MRFWPRSIRWQLLVGMVLLESLSMGLFGVLMLREQRSQVRDHMAARLNYQANFAATQAAEAFGQQRPEWAALVVKMIGKSPSVAVAKITAPDGRVLFTSQGEPEEAALVPAELARMPQLKADQAVVFPLGRDHWEVVRPIRAGGQLYGYAWIEADHSWDFQQIKDIRRSAIIFVLIWVTASALLALLITRSISRPLAVLHSGTRNLMDSNRERTNFPLRVDVQNEIGDVIVTFNQMVASLDEQRTGLEETLSVLDSMLANAPIGLAFFDRRCRLVRVNQVFADMNGLPLSRHLGRTLPELLPQPVAQQLEQTILRVFADGQPIRDLELNGAAGQKPWTWLASAYPVRTNSSKVRWVGVIILDSSDRKRSEEALRKTEKLAATGRLAASIAHEINNPLEAITNLLYLLRNFSNLEGQTLEHVVQAEHEAQRIAEITQQTLRFYRQSTSPSRTNLAELLDSVLSLYQGRLHGLGIEAVREYDASMELFCYAGEIRQVFANLIGNAIDATSSGGRIVIRARNSRNWKDGSRAGIRFTVADTGSGMEPGVRARVFEAFFSTKEATGTGLGLWVSQGIILKHGGLIHLRSRTKVEGKSSGTVFQIFFPDDPGRIAQQEAQGNRS